MITTFPKFSTLTIADKQEYEQLIKNYPPIADISFAGLMGWWGLYRAPEVALLNGNLIIRYALEGNDGDSGLSLIGTNDVDETVCFLFDYLKERGESPQLVHVPEFVVQNMQYPELFEFEGERNYDEYIISLSKFYPLEGSSHYQQQRVRKCIAKLHNSRVTAGPLDLDERKNRELLLNSVRDWPVRGINNLSKRENDALRNAITNATNLGLHNVCLTIDGVVHGFILFQAPHDRKYVTLEYVRVSYAIPYILNFMSFMFAEWMAKQEVEHVNLCMDYGKPILRVAKLALGPVNFFRKYKIKPQPSMLPVESETF